MSIPASRFRNNYSFHKTCRRKNARSHSRSGRREPSIYLTSRRTVLSVRCRKYSTAVSTYIYVTSELHKGDKYLSSGTLPRLLDRRRRNHPIFPVLRYIRNRSESTVEYSARLAELTKIIHVWYPERNFFFIMLLL